MIRETLKNYSFKELLVKTADEYVWSILKHIPGLEGVILRFLYLKVFAAKVEGFVAIQRDVHIRNSFGLKLGKNVYMNRGCHIDAFGGITIGDFSALGPQVILISSDHGFLTRGSDYMGHAWVKRPISIGKYTMVCANSYINPGVTIGNNVVVAAGSAIFVDLPDNAKVSTSRVDTYSESMRHSLSFQKRSQD
jgi:acetyltransferase-like isoleucine patch superfamily enzyme